MKTETPTRPGSITGTTDWLAGTVVGGGGKGTKAGDPTLGPEGGWDIPGDPPGDFKILVEMLKRIQKTLGGLVNLTPPIIDPAVQTSLSANWATADTYFALMIDRLGLEAETPIGKYLQTELYIRLALVGMTGEMLKMKQTSLNFHLNRVDKEIFSDVLPKPSWKDRAVIKVIRWVKPAMTIMNSIIGSLVKELPGGEIIKEMKEHTEAAYQTAEALRQDSEDGD